MLIHINYSHTGIDLGKFAAFTYVTEAVVWNLLDSSNSENKFTEKQRVNNEQLCKKEPIKLSVLRWIVEVFRAAVVLNTNGQLFLMLVC